MKESKNGGGAGKRGERGAVVRKRKGEGVAKAETPGEKDGVEVVKEDGDLAGKELGEERLEKGLDEGRHGKETREIMAASGVGADTSGGRIERGRVDFQGFSGAKKDEGVKNEEVEDNVVGERVDKVGIKVKNKDNKVRNKSRDEENEVKVEVKNGNRGKDKAKRKALVARVSEVHGTEGKIREELKDKGRSEAEAMKKALTAKDGEKTLGQGQE